VLVYSFEADCPPVINAPPVGSDIALEFLFMVKESLIIMILILLFKGLYS